MTQTSELGIFFRYDVSTQMKGDEPCSTAVCSHIASNALHIADVCGQVRVSWTAPTSAFYLDTIAPTSPDTLYRIAAFGPFPLTLKADSTPYPLRIRVAGLSDQGDSVTFRVCLTPLEGVESEVNAGGGNCADAETTSMTNAWLDSVIPGTATPRTTITLDSEQVRIATTEQSTLDPDGNAQTIRWVPALLEIWASTVDITSTPRLGGVYAAEAHV